MAVPVMDVAASGAAAAPPPPPPPPPPPASSHPRSTSARPLHHRRPSPLTWSSLLAINVMVLAAFALYYSYVISSPSSGRVGHVTSAYRAMGEWLLAQHPLSRNGEDGSSSPSSSSMTMTSAPNKHQHTSARRKGGAKVSYGYRLKRAGMPALTYIPGHPLHEALLPLPSSSASAEMTRRRLLREEEEEEKEGEGGEEEEGQELEQEPSTHTQAKDAAATAAAAAASDASPADDPCPLPTTSVKDQLQDVYTHTLNSPASVSFTIANEGYAHMFAEHWAMLLRVGIASTHLVVCLDAACHRHHCTAGWPHVFYHLTGQEDPTSPSSSYANTTQEVMILQVAQSKFEVAAALAEMGIDFLFLELDIWLRRNPMSLFAVPTLASLPPPAAAGAAATTANERKEDADTKGENAPLSSSSSHPSPRHVDVYIGGHYNNPRSLNIGFYFVHSSPHTTTLFTGLVHLMRDNPHVHDQVLMNCILRPNSHIQPTIGPQNSYRLGCPDKENIKYTPLARKAVDATYALHILDQVQVINSDVFDVHPETVAVHVLSNTPLSSRNGKVNVAKEFCLFEGANGYYDVGQRHTHTDTDRDLDTAGKKGYLMHDGLLYATLLHTHYRNLGVLILYLLHMVAVAKGTGRVLVLPEIVHYEKLMPAWELLDTATMDGYVEWRPSCFFEKAVFPGVEEEGGEEESVRIAQVHLSSNFKRAGVRTGLNLRKVEEWREAAEGVPVDFPLVNEDDEGEGQERWFALDETDTSRHLGQVIDLLNGDERLSEMPILRFSMDMTALSGGLHPCLLLAQEDLDKKNKVCDTAFPAYLPPEVDVIRQNIQTCQLNSDVYSQRSKTVQVPSRDCHEQLVMWRNDGAPIAEDGKRIGRKWR